MQDARMTIIRIQDDDLEIALLAIVRCTLGDKSQHDPCTVTLLYVVFQPEVGA